MMLPSALWLAHTRSLRPRLTGLLYLLATVCLCIALSLMGYLLFDDSVSATAGYVLKHRTEYAAIVPFNLLSVALMVAALPLIGEILRPASQRLSRLAITFGLIGCAVQALMNVFAYGAMALINGTPYREAFRPVEFQAIAHLCMTMFMIGNTVAFVFYGLCGALFGYLGFRSAFIPRALGAVVGVAGISWGMLIFAYVVDPIGPYLFLAGLVGQLVLGIWLLAKGVNRGRWNQMAGYGSDDEPPDGPSEGDLPMTERRPRVTGNITGRPKLVS